MVNLLDGMCMHHYFYLCNGYKFHQKIISKYKTNKFLYGGNLNLLQPVNVTNQ